MNMNEHERDLGIWKEGEREELADSVPPALVVGQQYPLGALPKGAKIAAAYSNHFEVGTATERCDPAVLYTLTALPGEQLNAAQQHADMFAERAHRLALLDIVTQCVVRHGSDAAIDAVEELFNYLKDT